MGIRPGLKVAIDIPQGATGAISEVRVRIEPVGCGREAALAVMEETAPKLLDSLRTYFQAQPERRSQARLPFDQGLGGVAGVGRLQGRGSRVLAGQEFPCGA